ncbi:hypothetical protein PFX98_12655 [Paucibacter sediminis]|uniref:Uncharacterized protein n=1 Tax=Paucibacter sediminis TaxID=3019553 RepID=A0AA95NFE2_9BURK|nr:hypothetical protein [Paucibacter sp. S2-9]WIT09796.1 hypothetical protein PFX98_12655 [Paucibacter sp. S2-9]
MTELPTFRSEAFAEDLEDLGECYAPGSPAYRSDSQWQRVLASLPLLAVAAQLVAQLADAWVGA